MSRTRGNGRAHRSRCSSLFVHHDKYNTFPRYASRASIWNTFQSKKKEFHKGVRPVYTTLVLFPETVTADTQCCYSGINIKAQLIPSFLGHLKNNKTFSHCSKALTTDVCVFHTEICWLSLLIMSTCQMSSKGFLNSSANKWFHIWLLSFGKDRGRPSQLEIKCSFAFKWSVYECTAWHNSWRNTTC